MEENKWKKHLEKPRQTLVSPYGCIHNYSNRKTKKIVTVHCKRCLVKSINIIENNAKLMTVKHITEIVSEDLKNHKKLETYHFIESLLAKLKKYEDELKMK